jgi:hypothetical protein
MGELSGELRRLRRGRGVMVSNLQARIGPILRMRAGISDSEEPSKARELLVTFLDTLAENLPVDLKNIFRVTLGLDKNTQFRFLEERTEWLAEKLDRDVRTVGRRFDEALELLDSAHGADRPTTYSSNLADCDPAKYQAKLLHGVNSIPLNASIRISFITVEIRRVE